MTARPRVGLLGGTFDPIHAGHLAAGRAAEHALDLDVVRIIPSARPPHRTDSPRASEYHRMEMIRLAIVDAMDGPVRQRGARWEVSDLELRRDGPSYTVDTLSALRGEGLAPSQICFIIGADAFAEIETWHRYPDVLDAAHFAVVTRPGTPLGHLRQRLPVLASRMTSPADVDTATTPRIFLIESHTPELSSTDIRGRAARGESLDGSVPPAVSAYIEQHSLYRD